MTETSPRSIANAPTSIRPACIPRAGRSADQEGDEHSDHPGAALCRRDDALVAQVAAPLRCLVRAPRLLDGNGFLLLRLALDLLALSAAAALWARPAWTQRWPLLLLTPFGVGCLAVAGLYRRRLRVNLLDGVVPLAVRAAAAGRRRPGLRLRDPPGPPRPSSASS